jgi:hypothetical protein
MPSSSSSRVSPVPEAEKRELAAVLLALPLDRAPNLHRFLEFVCRKYFEGNVAEIKEYTIAIGALNRPADFDPRSDTIVRVTAAALRKRLEQYYANEGAAHPVHIVLPPGHYVPSFVPAAVPGGAAEVEPPPERRRGLRGQLVLVAAFGLATAAFGAYRVLGPAEKAPVPPASAGAAAVGGGAALGTPALKALVGEGRPPYVDAAGQTWSPDAFCRGGRTFRHAAEEVQGTDEVALYLGGREGRFECRVPVPPGTYELHLYFADTFGGKEATREVIFSLNGGPPQALDVVSDAAGAQTATMKVYTDLQPLEDGAIHLDFASDEAFLNALEVLPGLSGRMQPLRLLAGRAVYQDRRGQLWLPDRFFFGGRRTYRAEGLPKVADPALFQWERFGHFRYQLPVVPGREYALSLYFSEGWFGGSNGGTGGVGSRVFDVYCNGTTLLKDFDILREQQDGVVVKTFRRVKPTAHGKLELAFTPVTNYPLVNAIEVVAEPPSAP